MDTEPRFSSLDIVPAKLIKLNYFSLFIFNTHAHIRERNSKMLTWFKFLDKKNVKSNILNMGRNHLWEIVTYLREMGAVADVMS